ncbi:hypothetical protein BOS5A_10023 [Bosea sp. EC-HK365B]|nr:hypothetical protein BOS5A_10023 [Bosea sp. EC-HK365B]
MAHLGFRGGFGPMIRPIFQADADGPVELRQACRIRNLYAAPVTRLMRHKRALASCPEAARRRGSAVINLPKSIGRYLTYLHQ